VDDKWLCSEWRCGWVGKEYLVAPDPFNEGCKIAACPNCREIGTLVLCCDEPGCDKESTCGTNTESGYRRTCFAHMPMRQQND